MTYSNKFITTTELNELVNREGWTHTYSYTVGNCPEINRDLPDDFRIEDCLEGFEYPLSLLIVSELDGVVITWLTSAEYVAGAAGYYVESPADHVTFEPLTIEGVAVINADGRMLDAYNSDDRTTLMSGMPDAFWTFDHSVRVPSASL